MEVRYCMHPASKELSVVEEGYNVRWVAVSRSSFSHLSIIFLYSELIGLFGAILGCGDLYRPKGGRVLRFLLSLRMSCLDFDVM